MSTRDELLAELQELATSSDPELAHGRADDILLELIADQEIEDAYHAITRWYA